MPSTEILIAFTAAALIVNISPGPPDLYVVARAIAKGTKGGIVAALGLAMGSMELVAVSSSKASRWLLNNERAQKIQDRISGSILFGMGAFIVADEATNLKT